NNATATLTSATPGVLILDGASTYASIAPQGTTAGLPFRFVAPSALTCGGAIDFTLSVTSTLGTSSQDFKVRLGVPSGTGAPITYTRTQSVGIPDNSPTGIADSMTITDDYEIADVDYRVDDIHHTFTGDLTVLLRSPNGVGTD